MTERLYYTDSYTTKFKAKVVDIKNVNGKIALLLDKTYFYPTSGGQEHDTGYINTAKVVDVLLSEDEEVLHIIEGEISTGEVECTIDWERRFSNMQQHTGQHILSRAFEILFSCETVSSRLGDDIGTIDLDAVDLNYDKIHEVEELSNKIVWENREVKIHLINASEVSKFPLRKPPKVSGTIRIIEVKDFDFSPCGGTHVSRTGEIGLIKIRRWERVKGGLTRVEFVCGIRALRDFQNKNKISNELVSILSVPEVELPAQVNKILDLQKEKQKLINSLTERIIDFEAEKLLQSSEKINGINFVIAKFENRSVNELKIFARKFLNLPNTVSILGSKTDGANVIMTRSPEVEIDLREILKEVLSVTEGRGGGKADFVQCGGSAENFEKMFDISVEKLKTKIS
ncbi:alanyl-tRNA synthetase [Candidatus Thermokryptus mobilis]|uniref:Alanine--tRNA ligase n=1 Tax=Candidatus Thermokryptus mobilis TaxID=1643428 RepID=A0A0S4MS61_9BACT|nr:DHHA1 domain-containing protein [Candidatus Thermokryptus mobilis]CUU01916.1 alanyl-tRNA synthetase [Candidatus Thermokryptus mobilis]